MATQNPNWRIQNEGSFATIHVSLPPQTSVHCESDAVVSFSHGIRVRGVMSGGILSSLARYFLTKESFFTTIVENTILPQERDDTQTLPPATVMMAPSNPGGIVLHRIGNTPSTTTTSTNTHNLLLISGAYIASDSSIVVESTRQTHAKVSTVLLSGTGYCVLRASISSTHNEGRGERGNKEGIIAFGAYGSVHKFVLSVGEIRAVDNGHVLAWSESMTYWMDLANASSSSGGATSGIGNRVYNSVTSGEGLMCFFEGPGVVYVQSHKLDNSSNNTTSTNSVGRSSSSHRRSNGGGNSVCGTIFGLILIFFMILVFGILPNVYPDEFGFLLDSNNNHGKNGDNYYGRSSSSSSSQQQRYNSRSQQQRHKYTREL